MLADLLQERGKDDRDIALKNASRIAGLENYLKKHTGTLEAFERGSYVAAKQRTGPAEPRARSTRRSRRSTTRPRRSSTRC